MLKALVIDDGLPMVAGRMECTLMDLERRARIHLRNEQAKSNPDNALIATLCDAVRCAREYVEYATGPIYVPPSREAADPLRDNGAGSSGN